MNTNPLSLIVFGATGDLYQNKLSNALFNLFRDEYLPADSKIFGFARRKLSDEEFRNFTKESILKHNSEADKKSLGVFLKKIYYIAGDLENLESYKKISQRLGAEDAELGECTNKLFYLAVPPPIYEVIFKNISLSGLTIPCAPGVDDKEKWTRVLVEKPFGKNLEHAKHLDKLLGDLFEESQIFRIDHYLGKEALQNILTFRFEDGSLEQKWSNENIEKVKIIIHEKNTVGKRGALYDGLGILRDIGQNHMLQMLALVTMGKPESLSVENIRKARREILERLIVLPKKIVRAQYEGYLKEDNVNSASNTETFFRIFLGVNTDRWRGVEFELEAGKALSDSEVSIEVDFKDKTTSHKFSILENKSISKEAYGKVLHDCITGDQTIFTTTGEIMAEWRIVEEVMRKWESELLVIYKVGAKASDID